MEAWVCIVILASGNSVTFEMQNEDATVIAAKSITDYLDGMIFCVNQFDGKTLRFYHGKQVDE